MLLDDGRETIGTSVLDAEPDVVLRMPGDSPAPLLLALGLAGIFIGMIVSSHVTTALAAALTGVSVLVWLWPEARLGQRREAGDA